MADVLFLVVFVAFFALAVLFVKACERIVGPDTEAQPAAEPDVEEPKVAA